MSHDFYMRPILKVKDVLASLAYYKDKLGFERVWGHSEEELIVAQVSRQGMDVILDSKTVMPKSAIPAVLSVSLHEPKDLRSLHEEFRSKGAKGLSAPAEVPWQKGLFQFIVEDLDGNQIVFWGEVGKA